LKALEEFDKLEKSREMGLIEDKISERV